MCEYCENGIPCGAGLESDDMGAACANQLAESLRDAIRGLGHGASVVSDEEIGREIDRCINELVRRAKEHNGPV